MLRQGRVPLQAVIIRSTRVGASLSASTRPRGCERFHSYVHSQQ